MKDYYKILGIDELTSKPLVRIAYATVLEYSKSNTLSSDQIKDINEAYMVLSRYRTRIRYHNSRSTGKVDAKIQDIINKVNSNSESGSTGISKTPSRSILEIRYIIKSLLFEVFTFFFYIISSFLGDLFTIMSSGVSFLSSLIFYLGLINILTNWVPVAYSYLAIIGSIGILVWFLHSFKNQVRRNLVNAD